MTTTTEFQHFSDDTDCFVKQRRTAAVQTGSFSGDAHILAWTPKGDDVHRRQLCTMQSADIAEVLYLRQPFFCHTNGKRFNFRRPDRHNACQQSGKWKTAAAVKEAAKGEVTHLTPLLPNIPFASHPESNTHHRNFRHGVLCTFQRLHQQTSVQTLCRNKFCQAGHRQSG